MTDLFDDPPAPGAVTADVRDETGRAPALAATISTTLSAALPVIEALTALPAGPCTVRLLTPAAWITEVRDYVDRTVQHEFATDPATPQEAQWADQYKKMWRAQTRWRWPLLGALTVTAPDGNPETLIAPAALRHTGHADTLTGVQRLVIHEAVHHAQIRFSAGRVVPPPNNIRPGPWTDRALDMLIEGHADWTELLVTYNLSGRQWPDPETRRTSPHTLIRLALLDARNTALARWEHIRRRAPAPERTPRDERRAARSRIKPVRPLFEPGRAFVEQTLLAAGPEPWNRIWTDMALVPTDEEIAEPDAWKARTGL